MSPASRARLDPLGLILIAAGIGAVVLLLVNDLRFAARHPGLSINGQSLWGRDFVNLWSAGRLWLDGLQTTLYDVEAYQAWQRAALGPGIDNHNYSYPPVSLFYAPLLGALPYPAALALFLALSTAALALAARPWLRAAGLGWWWALLLPSTLLCLWAGHYGLVVAALWCLAFAQLRRRPALAGLATGLMLIKPHLAILMPLLLARQRAWTAFAVAALTVGVLIAASLLLFGADLWRTYLASTSGLQLALVGYPDTLYGWMMPTWAPTLVAWGAPLGSALFVQAGLAVLNIGALVWRLPDDPIRAGALGAVATFIVLPYGFNYDLTIVGLAALLFLADASRRAARADAFLAGLALALPPATLWLNAAGVRVAPLILTALFALMWRRWTVAD